MKIYMYRLNEFFPFLLTMFPPKAKEHLRKNSTPGIIGFFCVAGHCCPRDYQNITGRYYSLGYIPEVREVGVPINWKQKLLNQTRTICYQTKQKQALFLDTAEKYKESQTVHAEVILQGYWLNLSILWLKGLVSKEVKGFSKTQSRSNSEIIFSPRVSTNLWIKLGSEPY